MANSDKNIVITPNISQAAQPSVVFKGQGNVPITLRVLDDSFGTLSFEGSAGQLFSINNNLTTGVIFSVNDVSGIPQIDVNADGTIRLAPFGSNLQIAGLTVGKGGSGISSNTAFGFSALAANTTGVQNTAFGYEAAVQTTTGSDIVAIGWRALKNPTAANASTAVGSNALAAVTTATDNTAVGRYAGYQLTTGGANTILGGAMYSATTAYYNVAIGHQTLNALVSGTFNTAVGYRAALNVTGQYNACLGHQVASGLTSGNWNTVVGPLALPGANGSNNVVVGGFAAQFQADGSTSLTSTSNSVYVGYQTRGFSNSDSNSIVIGYQAIGKGANTTVLGNTSATQAWIYGTGIIYNSGGSNYSENLRLPESSLGWSVIHMGGAAAASGTGANQWSLLKTGAAESHRFEVRHNATAVFSILTDGSVGVNTTGQTSKFQINNSGSTGSPFYVDAGNPAGTTTLFEHTGANTPVPFRLTKSGYSGAADKYGILYLHMADHSVNNGAALYFTLRNSSLSEVEYAGIGARVNSNTAGSERGDLRFYTVDTGTARSTKMTIRYDGLVGVGTTDPNTVMDLIAAGGSGVNSIGAATVRVSPTAQNTYAALELRTLNGGNYGGAGLMAINESNYDSNLLFYTNAASTTTRTERMRITRNGYVGIGTTAPNKRLVIAGNAGDPSITIYKSPDGTLNSAQLVAAIGSGSSSSNSGTTGGAEYGIVAVYHNGTERSRLYAYDVGINNVCNFALDPMAFGTTTSIAQVYVAPRTAATPGTIVRGFTSQTAPLSAWQNSSGALLDYVSADGNTSITFTDMDWTPNYSGGVSSPSSGTFQKTSGNNGQWDAQVYSSEGFTKSAHVTFKASQINAYLMVGLNSDPSTNAVYSSIDYAIYCHADNYIYIYENGSQIGSNYGIYSTSTVLSVVYDGVNVTYYKDGTIIRQVARAVGNALYLDSSFYTLNGAINSVKFGPSIPNVGAQGTANYLAKFSTANSLVNSSIQDTGSGVIVNSVATPRYYSVSVNAGNATRLGQWYAIEGNVSFMIQVSSDTGSNSGTSTYLYNGGFNVISNTAGQYVKLIPLMIGRGHGDSADSSISSTDAGGWTVFLYTGTTNPAYTMGIAVGVPTGKANKLLRVTVTELRGGMTYTADGSSIAYPTTSSPYTLQHSYGNISSAGAIAASSYLYSNDIRQDYVRELITVRVLPNVVGDYIEICNYAENCDYYEFYLMGYQPGYQHLIKIYKFAATFATQNGTLQPCFITPGSPTASDFELEVIRSSPYDGRFRLRRTKGTSGHTVYIKIKYFGPSSLTLYSGTGTSSGLGSYTVLNQYFPTSVSPPPPSGGTGNGSSITISATSGVSSGTGGSVILQPGNSTSGLTPGKVIIDGPGGVPATRTVQLDISSNYAIARYNRALPNTVGGYVELFQNYMNSHAQMRITVNAWRPTSASSHSTKVYEWNNNYGYVNGSIPPVYSYPGGLVTDSDFELEVNRNLSTSYNEYRLRRTAGTVNYQAYITVECFNYQHSISEISGTGTSALGLSYIGYPTTFTTAISAPAPCGYDGSGNFLNLYGSSAVNNGNGGGIALYLGRKTGTGTADGHFLMRNGTATDHAYRKYLFIRAIPDTVGNYVEVFSSGTQHGVVLKISVHASRTVYDGSTYNSLGKTYELYLHSGTTNGIAAPRTVTGGGGGGRQPNEFELELYYSSNLVYVRLRRTKADATNYNNYTAIIDVECVNWTGQQFAITELSGTGTSTLGSAYLTNTGNYVNPVIAPPPVVGSSGAGNSVTIRAADGVTSGAGGSVVLQPGAQASTGGNGVIKLVSADGAYTVTISNYGVGGGYQFVSLSGANGSPAGWLFGELGITSGGSGYDDYSLLGNTSWATQRKGLSLSGTNAGVFFGPVINSTGMNVGLRYGSIGTIRVNDASSGGGSFAYTSNTTNIAAATNNLALNGSAFQRLNCTAVCNLTGIAPPATGSHVDGRMIRVYNVGTSALTLKHNSTDSTDVNRFYNVDLNDIVLAPRDYAELIYDGTNNGRGGAGWRVH